MTLIQDVVVVGSKTTPESPIVIVNPNKNTSHKAAVDLINAPEEFELDHYELARIFEENNGSQTLHDRFTQNLHTSNSALIPILFFVTAMYLAENDNSEDSLMESVQHESQDSMASSPELLQSKICRKDNRPLSKSSNSKAEKRKRGFSQKSVRFY